MVSGLLVHSVAGVLGYLFPLRCFAFTHVVFVPFSSQILYLDGSSSVFLGGVQPSPPVSRLSLGWPTRAISILRLSLFCSILGGSALRVFLLLAFGPLGWLFILSPYPWSTRCFCWSVPTLPSCSGGSSWVSASCLAPAFGGSLTRVYLFCVFGVFGLYRFGLLPFLLLRCFPWVVSSSMVVFVHSSHVRPLWSCTLLPVSSLTSPPWSWLCCFLRLRFVRRLSLSVVFLVPSRWGHPSLGRV